MNLISIKNIAIAIIAATLISSCTKEPNTAPAGPIGPRGAYGLNGANGANGANGNANVSSRTYTLTATDWGSTSSYFYATIIDTCITQAIQDSGTIQIFMSYDAGTIWNALPLTKYTSVTNSYSMGYSTQVNTINLQWTSMSLLGGVGSDPNTVFGANCSFKVICIAASGKRLIGPHMQLTNNEELKAALHFK